MNEEREQIVSERDQSIITLSYRFPFDSRSSGARPVRRIWPVWKQTSVFLGRTPEPSQPRNSEGRSHLVAQNPTTPTYGRFHCMVWL